MSVRLETRPDLCTGCRACVAACTFDHAGTFGGVGARLRVLKNDVAGVDRPLVCRQCDEPACVAACPTGALRRVRQGGPVFEEMLCARCGACASACPFGALLLHEHSRLPQVCDLCNGATRCAASCATGALVRVEVDA